MARLLTLAMVRVGEVLASVLVAFMPVGPVHGMVAGAVAGDLVIGAAATGVAVGAVPGDTTIIMQHHITAVTEDVLRTQVETEAVAAERVVLHPIEDRVQVVIMDQPLL